MSKDKKHDDKAPAAAAPAATTTSSNPTILDVAEDETAKVIGDEAAKIVWDHLPAGVRAKLHQHPMMVMPLLGIRLIPGLPKLASEGVSDFVGTLRRIAKAGPQPEGHSTASTPVTPTTPAQQQAVSAVSVIVAIEGLDKEDREDFMEWYLEEDNAVGFNQLVAGQDIPAIQKVAVMPKANLERMISSRSPNEPLDFLRLRAQIAANAELNNQTEMFLQAINAAGTDRTGEFWTAVQKRQLKSVAEFTSLMRMKDGEILDYLHMPRVTMKKRLDNAVAALDQTLGNTPAPTGATKWAQNLATKAKDWSKK